MTTHINPWNEAYRLAAGKRKSATQITTLRKPDGTLTADRQETLKHMLEHFAPESFINGLSDHDAQILILRNINIKCEKIQPIITRQINETTLTEFKLHLSDENWPNTFNEEDREGSFNNF
jgi:hypothetical protein